jgi:hypothetical protein
VSRTREAHTGSLTSGAMARVLPYNRKGGGKTTVWESDVRIVLGGRESRPHVPVVMGHGEGVHGHA